MTGSRNLMHAVAVLALLTPGAAWAEGAPDLFAILTTHDVIYDGIGWERHAANGRLMVQMDEDMRSRLSFGEWWLRGDARCLRWHRAMEWECYGVTLDGADGITFTDDYGNVSSGRLMVRDAE
ncbi:hypothetical protein [Roseicyclus mahoneyensis]|uniref:Protease inhibitor Inh n=1 Tax=Roseicyclus mahoneyensis TaxID=164332 RepID=A0A316GPG8_9RHOB|nr:hypothetical protein [Roseicyclus mahoneyensis]PWK62774.1 hypothetical protein C7455_101810 [Roseicyclus mahoneyensis]